MPKLRKEIEQNYDADADAAMRSSGVFDYFKTMGGEPDRRETKSAGWSDAQHARFVQLLNESAPERTSLGADLNEGLVKAGLNTERTVSDGEDLITVTGRAE